LRLCAFAHFALKKDNVHINLHRRLAILAALVLLVVPRNYRVIIRSIAVLAT